MAQSTQQHIAHADEEPLLALLLAIIELAHRDARSKKDNKDRLDAEEFIQWAQDEFEPTVTEVKIPLRRFPSSATTHWEFNDSEDAQRMRDTRKQNAIGQGTDSDKAKGHKRGRAGRSKVRKSRKVKVEGI